MTSQSTADQFAKWTYDSVAKGQPTSAVRYVGGSGTGGLAYISQTAAYDSLYTADTDEDHHPLRPREATSLARTPPASATTSTAPCTAPPTPRPAVCPPRPWCTATTNWACPRTSTAPPATSRTPSTPRSATAADHSRCLPVRQRQVGPGSPTPTRTAPDVSPASSSPTTRAQAWSRTAITATTRPGNPPLVDARANGVDDMQCYRYDGHDRLTDAFTSADTYTTTGACTAPRRPRRSAAARHRTGRPTRTTCSATAPRSSSTAPHQGPGHHVTNYGYGAEGGGQPHTLSSSTTTQSGAADKTERLRLRLGGQHHQPHHRRQVPVDRLGRRGPSDQGDNADGTSVSYLYDADGNRLLARDATGTTLYLGDSEIHLAKGTTSLSGTRYYTYAGQTIAVRTCHRHPPMGPGRRPQHRHHPDRPHHPSRHLPPHRPLRQHPRHHHRAPGPATTAS